MASFHLVSGVFCVALVSRYLHGETFQTSQLVGFGLLAIAMVLVLRPAPPRKPSLRERLRRNSREIVRIPIPAPKNS